MVYKLFDSTFKDWGEQLGICSMRSSSAGYIGLCNNHYFHETSYQNKNLSVSHIPCRDVDISLQCSCLFYFSVITCQAQFAWQPVVHLQSIVSHHLSTLFSVYQLNTLYFSLCHSHNQSFTSCLPVVIFGQLPFFPKNHDAYYARKYSRVITHTITKIYNNI